MHTYMGFCKTMWHAAQNSISPLKSDPEGMRHTAGTGMRHGVRPSVRLTACGRHAYPARMSANSLVALPRLTRFVRKSILRRLREGAPRDLLARQYGVSLRWLAEFERVQ